MHPDEILSGEMIDRHLLMLIEVREKLVGVDLQLGMLVQQVARQNSNVADLMAWRQGHMLDQRHIEGVQEGRIMVRAEDRARVQFVGRILQNEYVRLGLMAGGIGAVVRLWPW